MLKVISNNEEENIVIGEEVGSEDAPSVGKQNEGAMIMQMMEMQEALDYTKTILAVVINKVQPVTITEEDYNTASEKFVKVDTVDNSFVFTTVDTEVEAFGEPKVEEKEEFAEYEAIIE